MRDLFLLLARSGADHLTNHTNTQIRRSPFWQVRLAIHQNALFDRRSPTTRQASYHSIVLAVKRKELVLCEKGLVYLGLCCLIARRMALNSFQLFITQVQTAPEVLKLCVLQVAFDVCTIVAVAVRGQVHSLPTTSIISPSVSLLA